MARSVATWLMLAACLLAVPEDAAAQQPAPGRTDIVISTGGPTGVYFIAGHAICRLLAIATEETSVAGKRAASGQDQKPPGMGCSVITSAGSLQNLALLRDEEINLALVQSDWQFHAANGSASFKDRRIDNLRALFSMHAEPIQLIVARTSSIWSFADLKGRSLNIGNAGSGQRATFEQWLAANGVDRSYFGQTLELSQTEQSKAFCAGRVDAILYAVGVPNAAVKEVMTNCGGRMLPLMTDGTRKLIEQSPYYAAVTVPKQAYASMAGSVQTFGVVATVVATSQLSEEAAYQLVRAVFDRVDVLRKLHPAFALLDPRQMATAGLSAQLHPGARRYFAEKGLLAVVRVDQ